jgi:hypothetical protein
MARAAGQIPESVTELGISRDLMPPSLTSIMPDERRRWSMAEFP